MFGFARFRHPSQPPVAGAEREERVSITGVSAFRFLGDVLRRFPLLVIGSAALILAESFVAILSLATIVPIVELLVSGSLGTPNVATRNALAIFSALALPVTVASFLGLLVCLQTLRGAFTVATRYVLAQTRLRMLQDLMGATLEGLFASRWSFFSSHQQGVLSSTFSRQMTAMENGFAALATMVHGGCALVFYLALPFYLSWQVTSLSLATAVLLSSPFLLFGRVNYRLGSQYIGAWNDIGVIVNEAFTCSKLILGFGNQPKVLKRFRDRLRAYRRVALKTQTLGAAIPAGYEPLGAMVLVVAIASSNAMAVPLSHAVVVLWALRSAIPLIGSQISQRNALANFLPNYEELIRLAEDAAKHRQTSGAVPFPGVREVIALERVSFAHPDREPALTDVSLRIRRGMMTAVVGQSGAGKSTVVDLLMRFHDPLSGRVTIDGRPLGEFDITSYRRRIGYVPQEVMLLDATIRDNLRWANDRATDGEIEEACRLAHAHEFIARLPSGYDTIVGDRGARLSGGQCQRVALARAILRRPDLLILDEATSALDTESERLIQHAIESISRQTTVLVIAHRLSTIVNADYVYVLQGGRLVEEGRYQDLIRQGGIFRRMTSLQTLGAD